MTNVKSKDSLRHIKSSACGIFKENIFMEGDRMKMWFLALAVPTLVHAYYPTNERDCSGLNLQNDTLGAVRNQGKISWCYAFTASDMLSHTFDKEQISAADVA